MSRILFADTSHPKAYGFDDLAAHAMGGTESSVLRTAKILSKHKHTVSIYQQHRERHEHQQGVNFIGPAQLAALEAPDHVVVLRKFPQLRAFQQQPVDSHLQKLGICAETRRANGTALAVDW